jgi:hypothetical protein
MEAGAIRPLVQLLGAAVAKPLVVLLNRALRCSDGAGVGGGTSVGELAGELVECFMHLAEGDPRIAAMAAGVSGYAPILLGAATCIGEPVPFRLRVCVLGRASTRQRPCMCAVHPAPISHCQRRAHALAIKSKKVSIVRDQGGCTPPGNGWDSLSAVGEQVTCLLPTTRAHINHFLY